jgi:hypothetical protein
VSDAGGAAPLPDSPPEPPSCCPPACPSCCCAHWQWKVAPALAAGNCCVLKPSEVASVTCLELAELASSAGLPAGVLNVVTGLGADAGAPLRRVGVLRVLTEPPPSTGVTPHRFYRHT